MPVSRGKGDKAKPAKVHKLSWHKERAWKAFSLYVRTRDCLSYDPNAAELHAKCITCDYVYPLKQLQAGHFIPGRNNAVLFSEQGVHAQCNACNKYKKGNTHEYWPVMEALYGRETIDRLIFESKQTVKYKSFDYDRIAEEFKDKLISLTNKVQSWR